MNRVVLAPLRAELPCGPGVQGISPSQISLAGLCDVKLIFYYRKGILAVQGENTQYENIDIEPRPRYGRSGTAASRPGKEWGACNRHILAQCTQQISNGIYG